MLQTYNKILKKTYRILNYTRINPRSRPPQKKKSAYFTHPDFPAAKIEKKSAQIKLANAVVHVFTSLICCTFSNITSIKEHIFQ